ncbi:MAG: hypothetical protein O2992_13685 [Gemmatimonadetes bacterium]|nr:hypothetical protein [Gemmatimonadota bacterium]
MTNRRLLPVLLVAFAACSESPIGPDLLAVDDAIVAQFAEEASEASDVRLPSLRALVHASRAAIEASGGNEEAVRFFRHARKLAVAAADSAEIGAEEAARQLGRRSYAVTLRGVVAALGDAAAADALAGSAAGLARIQTRIADREVPARIAAYLERIEARIAEGQNKLSAGEPAVALHHALSAAEAIRGLSPAYLARKWIAEATQLVRSAVASVGDAPTEEEAKALRQARWLLGAAKEAHTAGSFGRAIGAATRAATLAATVLQGRG